MEARKADARSGNCERQGFPNRTGSIVADMATFRLAASTVAFTIALLAVPTVMAVLKQWGWW